MRPLVQRAHGGREGLLAGAALIQAGARALALKLSSLAYGAAMRTGRTIGPAEFFEMHAGGGFVGENLISEVTSHGKTQFFTVGWRRNSSAIDNCSRSPSMAR